MRTKAEIIREAMKVYFDKRKSVMEDVEEGLSIQETLLRKAFAEKIKLFKTKIITSDVCPNYRQARNVLNLIDEVFKDEQS